VKLEKSSYKDLPVRKSRCLRTLLTCMLMLFIVVPYASAQQASTMYLMQDIPQSNQLNPAVQPACKIFIGLPVLNTIHLNYSNDAFTYNDLADGTQLQLDEVYNRLGRMNALSAELIVYSLSAGIVRGPNYFSVSVADRLSTYNSYSRRLAGLLLYGNTQYIGETARLNNNRINLMYYREYSAGWSMEYNSYNTIGARVKLLFGKANLNTGSSRALLGTDAETFDLSVTGNVRLNSSYPLVLEQNNSGAITGIDIPEPDYFRLLMNPRNPGIAFDLGVIHQYSEKVVISASLLDLGMIVWTDDLYNIGAEVDFLYEGVSEGTDFSTAAYFRDLTDSIASDIIYDVTRKPYVSPLPTQLYLAGSYDWKKHTELGLVMRSVLVNRRIKTSLTASVTASVVNRLQASLSWSWMNKTAYNFGAGLAYTGRGFQVYAVTDNLAAFIQPPGARTINLRFGMNLLLGCPVSYNRNRGDERSMVPCPPATRDRRRR